MEKGNPVAKRRTRRMKPRSSRDSIGDGTASAIQDPIQDQHETPVTAVCDNASNPTAGPPRRHHHHHPSLQPSSSVGNPSSSSSPTSATHSVHFQAESGAGLWTCFKLLIVTFAILLFFNALLFFRVKELENRKVNYDSYDIETEIDSMMNGLGAGKTATSNPEVWLKLMRKQQKLHDLELEKWHRVLDSTMEVMSLMQESLRVLHQSVSSRHRRPKGKRGKGVSGESDSSSESSSLFVDETLDENPSAAADGNEGRTTMEQTATQKLRAALKPEL